MAELFQTTVANVNMHIRNVFEEGELAEAGTIKDFLIVQTEGNREVSHELASEPAAREFEKFDAACRRLEVQQPTSDFDKEVKRIEQKRKKPKKDES